MPPSINRLLLLVITTAALSGCATLPASSPERLGVATIADAQGATVGTAQVVAVGDKATMTVAVAGMAPGVHGIHLHTTGTCTGPAFTSAGGHLNPLGRQHGKMNPAGRHAGDLPNLSVGADGAGTLTIALSGTRSQITEWLFDTDGTAVVIHAAPDDYRTDPAGNSGDRIACGVVKSA